MQNPNQSQARAWRGQPDVGTGAQGLRALPVEAVATDRRWWRRPGLLVGLLLLGAASGSAFGAQPKGAKATASADRCLLIVETSKSMQRRSDGVLGAVRGLLMSSLNGQLREGGTLGVWTYNEDLYAGRFPLQTWSFAAQNDITERTLGFLRAQKYQKQASFHKVAPSLSSVIKDSESILVILISTGDHEVRGTGFDDRINTAYRRWSSQQQKARMPFVTVLSARRGQIIGCTVNTPPWPVAMPRLPEDTNQAAVVQAKLMEAVRKPQTSSVPPLIVSGKKLQAEQAPAPKPEPAAAKPAPPPAVAPATNAPVAVTAPDKVSPPIEPARVEPVPVAPAQPVPQAPPKPAPALVSVSEPKPADVKPPEAKVVETPPAKPEVVPAPAVPKPKPEPAAVEQPKAPPVPEVKAQPAPAPPLTNVTAPAPPTVAPAAAPVAVVAEPTNASAASLAPPPPSRPAPRAQSATATPATSVLSGKTLWIGAALLAVLVFGAGILRLRRARTAPQGSLITRSLEREKEP